MRAQTAFLCIYTQYQHQFIKSYTQLKLRPKIDMHSLDLRVSLQARLSELPSNTTLLHATERNTWVAVLARVDPHHTRLNLRRNTMCLLNITREDRSAKTVNAVVRSGDGFGLVLERADDSERPEDFFLPNRHVLFHVCEDGRLDEEALAIDRAGLAADGECRALGFALVDVRQDAVELCFGDLGALESVLVPLGADLGDF